MWGASRRTRRVPAELSGGKCGLTNRTRRVTRWRSCGVALPCRDEAMVERLVLISDRSDAEAALRLDAARAAIDLRQPADRVAHVVERVADESCAAVLNSLRHAAAAKCDDRRPA